MPKCPTGARSTRFTLLELTAQPRAQICKGLAPEVTCLAQAGTGASAVCDHASVLLPSGIFAAHGMRRGLGEVSTDAARVASVSTHAATQLRWLHCAMAGFTLNRLVQPGRASQYTICYQALSCRNAMAY